LNRVFLIIVFFNKIIAGRLLAKDVFYLLVSQV
jgi:hypothetical protein